MNLSFRPDSDPAIKHNIQVGPIEKKSGEEKYSVSVSVDSKTLGRKVSMIVSVRYGGPVSQKQVAKDMQATLTKTANYINENVKGHDFVSKFEIIASSRSKSADQVRMPLLKEATVTHVRLKDKIKNFILSIFKKSPEPTSSNPIYNADFTGHALENKSKMAQNTFINNQVSQPTDKEKEETSLSKDSSKSETKLNFSDEVRIAKSDKTFKTNFEDRGFSKEEFKEIGIGRRPEAHIDKEFRSEVTNELVNTVRGEKTHLERPTFDTLAAQSSVSQKRLTQAFGEALKSDKIFENAFEHISDTFDDTLRSVDDKATIEDLKNAFLDAIRNNNTHTEEIDRETFEFLTHKFDKPEGSELTYATGSQTKDIVSAENYNELRKDFKDGTWKAGEEREFTSHYIPPSALDQTVAGLEKLFDNASFEKAFNTMMRPQS